MCASQTFHDLSAPEMLPSICAQHIDRPQRSPRVYHEQREQIDDVAAANDEAKIHQLVMTARMSTALRHRQTMYETDYQTSSTCSHESADANQMIEFEDEIQSNPQQLRRGPCCIQKQNTTEINQNRKHISNLKTWPILPVATSVILKCIDK